MCLQSADYCRVHVDFMANFKRLLPFYPYAAQPSNEICQGGAKNFFQYAQPSVPIRDSSQMLDSSAGNSSSGNQYRSEMLPGEDRQVEMAAGLPPPDRTRRGRISEVSVTMSNSNCAWFSTNSPKHEHRIRKHKHRIVISLTFWLAGISRAWKMRPVLARNEMRKAWPGRPVFDTSEARPERNVSPPGLGPAYRFSLKLAKS